MVSQKGKILKVDNYILLPNDAHHTVFFLIAKFEVENVKIQI